MQKQLTFFSSIDGLYVDVTFRSAPKFFHQLYNSLTHYVQLAFFLPANKHPASCEDVFRHTVSEAEKLGVNVFPTVFFSDFETAIHNAVTTVWPGFEIKVCRFHFGQSSWRKI